MTQINAIRPVNDQKSVYNALKIQVNSPQTYIPENLKNINDNSEYNAVSIEVNEPKLNVKKEKSLFSYPDAVDIVTYEQAGFMPFGMPDFSPIPIAYQTNLINNKTFVNADFDVKQKKQDKLTEKIQVPEPNFVKSEDEKEVADNNKNPNFNGLSFKANSDVKIKDADVMPSVNTEEFVNMLNKDDFETQARALDKIASLLVNNKNGDSELNGYLVPEVFSALANLIDKDSSNFEKPDEKQIEARKKIIMNEVIMQKMLSENPDKKPEDIDTGITITKEDIETAMKFSPFEMAERNKEYGIYILAGLTKAYIEEYQKTVGEVVSLTDLPCISSIMSTLKSSENPDLKIAAINALLVIQKPEYKQEINSILQVVSKDKNPEIAQYSAAALKALDKVA